MDIDILKQLILANKMLLALLFALVVREIVELVMIIKDNNSNESQRRNSKKRQ